VYLCHLIPIQLFQGSSILAPHAATRAVLTVAASVALAALATKYVELPLNKVRQSRIPHAARLDRTKEPASKGTLGRRAAGIETDITVTRASESSP